MLRLKLQYFGHLIWRANSLEKDPDAGKDWRLEEKGTTEDEMVGWHHWLNGQVWANSKRQWGTGKSGLLQSMGSPRVGHDWVTEQPHNGESARNTLTKWSWSSPLQLQVTLPKSSPRIGGQASDFVHTPFYKQGQRYEEGMVPTSQQRITQTWGDLNC